MLGDMPRAGMTRIVFIFNAAMSVCACEWRAEEARSIMACRPTKRVSSKTPRTKSEMSGSLLSKKKREKARVGMGKRVKSLSRNGKKSK